MKKKSATLMIFATLLVCYGVFGIFTLFINDAGTAKVNSPKQLAGVNEAQAAETNPALAGKSTALRIKRMKLAAEQPHHILHRSLSELSETLRRGRHKYRKLDKEFCDKSVSKNEPIEIAGKVGSS